MYYILKCTCKKVYTIVKSLKQPKILPTQDGHIAGKKGRNSVENRTGTHSLGEQKGSNASASYAE